MSSQVRWRLCKDCRDEILVPWSCKTRQFCPSCGSRRGEAFAALLSERVLEPVSWHHPPESAPRVVPTRAQAPS
ncbi:MAG: transposase zinc-binding domain-containing protein [Candidatus Xenobia bacterium]